MAGVVFGGSKWTSNIFMGDKGEVWLLQDDNVQNALCFLFSGMRKHEELVFSVAIGQIYL